MMELFSVNSFSQNFANFSNLKRADGLAPAAGQPGAEIRKWAGIRFFGRRFIPLFHDVAALLY